MIAIVDYGLGNLKSVKYAMDRLGRESVLTAEVAEIAEASGVILPGVGAFGRAMQLLEQMNLLDVTRAAALSGKPLRVLWRQEKLRRIIWYSGWQSIMTLFLTFCLLGLIIAFGGSILSFLADSPLAAENIDNNVKGLTISVFTKLIITLGSGVGISLSSKSLSTSLSVVNILVLSLSFK